MQPQIGPECSLEHWRWRCHWDSAKCWSSSLEESYFLSQSQCNVLQNTNLQAIVIVKCVMKKETR